MDTESGLQRAEPRPADGALARTVRWAFLLAAVLLVVAWIALIALAQAGDRRVWAEATAALVLLGLLAVHRPTWAIYGCLLLRAVSLNYLYGWRDPVDGFYAPVEAAQLKVFGQLISMDSMQASFLLVVACVILFTHPGLSRGLKKIALPFVAFLALMGLSWALNGAELYGVKTAASVVTPILFAAAVYAAVVPRRDTPTLERLLYYSVAFSVGVGIVAELLGGKPLLAFQRGMFRFCGGTAPPGFSMVVFPALALAYSRALRQDWRAWFLVAVFLFLIGTTLTRLHLWVAMVVLVGGGLLAPRRKVRTVLVGVLVSVLVVFVFWDPLQRRAFGSGKLPGYLVRFLVDSELLKELDLEVVAEVDTSGRRALWRDYWRLARHRLRYGYGPGSAPVILERPDWTRLAVPHNEYLRLVIETGVPGAIAYFGALSYLLVVLWRRRGPEGQRAVWVDAAGLSVAVLLMLAASENVLYVQGFPSTVLAVAAVAIKSADVEGAKEASSGADGRCHS